MINPDFLPVLEQMHHAIIICNRQHDIVWRNNVAQTLFDIDQIQQILVRRAQLSARYDKGPSALTLPTRLDFPVSFSSIPWADHQVLVSGFVGSDSIEQLRQALIDIVDNSIVQTAEKLTQSLEELLHDLSPERRSSRQILQERLSLLKLQSRRLSNDWKETRRLLRSLESVRSSTERIDIRVVSQRALDAFQASTGTSLTLNYFNEDYGVIYGDEGLLVDSLCRLLCGFTPRQPKITPFEVGVHQTINAVIWQWSAHDSNGLPDIMAKGIWGLQGGRLQVAETGNGWQISALMPSGGKRLAQDRDYALWAENEIHRTFNIQSEG